MRISRRDVRLTNLDKVFFPGPGLTKGRYYVAVVDAGLHAATLKLYADDPRGV